MEMLIVASHRMFGESIANLVEGRDDVDRVTVVDTPDAIRQLGSALRCDVAVVDWHLGDSRGSDAIDEIRRHVPSAKVVVISGSPGVAVLEGANAAGCDAFVTKYRDARELLLAIDASISGADPDSQSCRADAPSERLSSDEALSSREVEVVECITLGMSNSEIGETLFISVNTVRNHIQRISSKLGECSRIGIAMSALRDGLVELPAAC